MAAYASVFVATERLFHSLFAQISYGKLTSEFKAKNAEFDQLQSEIADKKAREVQIQNFIRRVRELDTFVTEFDKGLWSDTVEYMTVYSKEKWS